VLRPTIDVWSRESLANGIAASVTMAIETAAACGQISADFLHGTLVLAKAQALQYGLSWPALATKVQAAIGEDHALLLELTTVVIVRLLFGVVAIGVAIAAHEGHTAGALGGAAFWQWLLLWQAVNDE
jgi:hypothetical protein